MGKLACEREDYLVEIIYYGGYCERRMHTTLEFAFNFMHMSYETYLDIDHVNITGFVTDQEGGIHRVTFLRFDHTGILNRIEGIFEPDNKQLDKLLKEE